MIEQIGPWCPQPPNDDWDEEAEERREAEIELQIDEQRNERLEK